MAPSSRRLSSQRFGRALVFAIATAAGMAPLGAHAAYTMTISQVGADVVATGSGSINTTALSGPGAASTAALVWPGLVVDPEGYRGAIEIGATTNVVVDVYRSINMSGPTGLGTGPLVFASSGSGALVGAFGGLAGDARVLYVPDGYVSGAALGTSTSTWANTTIAALGLTPGTHVWSWGSGATADTLTIVIEGSATPTAVPSLGMGALGALAALVAGVAAFTRRRAKRVV